MSSHPPAGPTGASQSDEKEGKEKNVSPGGGAFHGREKSDNICPICEEEISPDDNNRAILVPCCHDFHKTCIDHWLRNRQTCPECRQIVLCVRRNVKSEKEFESRDLPIPQAAARDVLHSFHDHVIAAFSLSSSTFLVQNVLGNNLTLVTTSRPISIVRHPIVAMPRTTGRPDETILTMAAHQEHVLGKVPFTTYAVVREDGNDYSHREELSPILFTITHALRLGLELTPHSDDETSDSSDEEDGEARPDVLTSSPASEVRGAPPESVTRTVSPAAVQEPASQLVTPAAAASESSGRPQSAPQTTADPVTRLVVVPIACSRSGLLFRACPDPDVLILATSRRIILLSRRPDHPGEVIATLNPGQHFTIVPDGAGDELLLRSHR